MLVHISDITVKKRIRKDVSGIDELADSIRKYGLLTPIILDDDYVLIAGFRRLQAAKRLGWTSIPATVVDASDKIGRMEIELEENVQRSNFTDEEMLEGYAALERLKNPGLLRRIGRKIKSFFAVIFEAGRQSRADKRRKNALLSLTALFGIALAILSGVLHKGGYISYVLLTILNVVSAAAFLYGLFFFIRFTVGSKKKFSQPDCEEN